MKGVMFILIFAISLFAKDLTPFREFNASGAVQEIVLSDNLLYVATIGEVQIFDIEKNSLVGDIKLEPIEDFFGDFYKPKVFSVDVSSKGILILQEENGGNRAVRLFKDGKSIELVKKEQKLFIKKAKLFEDFALYATIGGDVILQDLKTLKIIYNKNISVSSFSDFKIVENEGYFSFESGEVKVVDIKSGQVLREIKGINKDNVYKVDIAKDVLATAGQDRKIGLYSKNGKAIGSIDGEFLIYAVALSLDGKSVVFPANEKNELLMYDIAKKELIYKLIGHKSTLNTIVFKTNERIFSSSDDEFIYEWRLK
ncbi:MAG: hypothetical protein HXX81_00360 [Campylobacterales bacterium]|nr:hypothetical protein [Campylobacterales bacterium]